MAQKRYFLRTNFLIQRSLQLKYTALVLFTILAVSGVIVWTVYFTHWTLLTDQVLNGTSPKILLGEIFHKVNTLLLWELPVVLLIAAFASIIVSHKIAGPVYRMEKIAKEVAKGDLSFFIRLRKNDELKNLAAAFNSVIENMQNLVVKDKRLIGELSELSIRLYNDLKDKKINETEALELIRRLNDLVAEMKNLILQYKLEKGK